MFLLKLKAAWSWIASAAETVWNAVKKLPGWAVLVVLLLLAVCWWLYRALSTKTVLSEIQTERVAIETDYKKSVETILNKESEEAIQIREEYEEKNKELDEKEKELFKSISKGPVEIAKEWDLYLRGKNEK